MGKKISISELLDSAILDTMDAGKKTKELKAQRNTGLSNHVENKDSEAAQTQKGMEGKSNKQFSKKTTVPALSKLGTAERKNLEAFMAVMESENYLDKKEQFIFRLSRDCFLDYEKLTRTYNYKMGEKISRNDIMRKVLEHFHTQYIPQLLKTLERI